MLARPKRNLKSNLDVDSHTSSNLDNFMFVFLIHLKHLLTYVCMYVQKRPTLFHSLSFFCHNKPEDKKRSGQCQYEGYWKNVLPAEKQTQIYSIMLNKIPTHRKVGFSEKQLRVYEQYRYLCIVGTYVYEKNNRNKLFIHKGLSCNMEGGIN